MSSASRNNSQITMLEEIKDQKLLRALRGEVPEDEPQRHFTIMSMIYLQKRREL